MNGTATTKSGESEGKKSRARAEPSKTVDAAPGTQAAAMPGISLFLQKEAWVQTKLTVSQPGDVHEQEADSVADLAVQTPHSPGEEDPLTVSKAPGALQRQPAQGSAAPPVHPSIHVPDAGAPLSPAVRNRVEPLLGADLEQVRVHTSPSANLAARDLRAKAFTHGSHIWLAGNQSTEDVGLMAHEAAHVVQQGATPRMIQRQETETEAPPAAPAEGEANRGQTFGFSEDEMETRLASTPPEGANASAPTVEVNPATQSTLSSVEGEAAEVGEGEGEESVPPEGGEGAEGAEATREGRGERGRGDARGRERAGGGGGEGGDRAPETPGPAAEFEGMVAENVAAYLEGNLPEERVAALEPRTRQLLEAVDEIGGRSITDPEAAALEGLGGEGLEEAAPTTGYEGEPLWLRVLAGIRDVTGQLGGVVGIIGLVATVSGFILSLLIPPVGAFLLTVGRFCDVAALILDAISLVTGIILTGYNLYRLKNETNPEERRRLLGMVRQDAMGTVMSAVAVATAVGPGAGRLLGRGARRVSSGLRTASRSATALGRTARAVRVVGALGRRAMRAGGRGVRALGRSASAGFRGLSRSSSLLGRAARGVRVAGVVGRRAMRSARSTVSAGANRALGWARGTMPVRWANRISGGAEEWARRRLRTLAASDTAVGRFYNRRIRGFHERNVMVARSINDPIERAYQERLGRELVTELDSLRQANPTWTAQQLDDALRARFGRERYGHAEVGNSAAGNPQFVRDDATFLLEIRQTEFTEIQLIRDLHPGATGAELERLVNASPFIKGRWTAAELDAFGAMHPTARRPTGELAVRGSSGPLAVSKTGHHTIPASMAPQISQDPRFIQIVNDSTHYRGVIDRAYPGMTHVPPVGGYRVRGASGRMRNALNRREVVEDMLRQGQIQGYTPADLDYFMGRGLADDLVVDGSSGVWINRRAPNQRVFFNPHLGIGHQWDWDNDLARQIFDMNSRLGITMRRELGDQLVAPAIRSSVREARDAGAGDPSQDRGPDERAEALVDQAIRARVAARRAESPAAQLPPLLEPIPMEPTGANTSIDPALGGMSTSLPEPAGLSETPGDADAADLMTTDAMSEMNPEEESGLPLFMMGAGTPGATTAGDGGPEAPPSPVLYSPQSLVSIREQRLAVAEAIGVVNDYISETREAEEHNQVAQTAAGSLKERNAEQRGFAEGERGAVSEEQQKLDQAGGAQENMTAENQRAASEAERGESEAGTVQSEGQGVSVEAKPEEPDSRGWLERAWDATAGALWDNLIAPAVAAVRRKVAEVMASINEFIMNMINQALGLDEIEAELNAGASDIQDRDASLSETDTGLQETQDQAAQEEERNQLSMDQAGVNIADSQVMREDAQTLLADLDAHNLLLQEEEAAGQTYIVDFGTQYQPFFEAQDEMGEPIAGASDESMLGEDFGFDALPPPESSFASEGAGETGVV